MCLKLHDKSVNKGDDFGDSSLEFLNKLDKRQQRVKHGNNEGNRKEIIDTLLDRIGRRLWPVLIKRIAVSTMTPTFRLGWDTYSVPGTRDTWGRE